jgi:hypothetical protein
MVVHNKDTGVCGGRACSKFGLPHKHTTKSRVVENLTDILLRDRQEMGYRSEDMKKCKDGWYAGDERGVGWFSDSS